jgi:RNA polymerase sigma-70 factor (ECF subfamily)
MQAPGASYQFQTTLWNVVLSAKESDGSAAAGAAALESLCRTYWYPLYAYVRRRGNDEQTAADLVQEFFSRMLEREFLKNVSPEKGRFRTLLLTSMDRFLIDEHDKRKAAKRGGRFTIVSTEELPAEERYRHEPADDLTPDKLFDRRWALTMLEKALAEVRATYELRGQSDLFGALQALIVAPSESESYAEIGRKLGLSESAVKMQVLRLRKRYQLAFRAEVAATVTDEGQMEAEIQHLMASL